jgi:cellulose 1,4-beta-cellobiosidase
MTRQTTSVRNLNLGHIARDAIHRHYLSASCYLISVEAGFEVWRGGRGLATTSFSVNVDGSGTEADRGGRGGAAVPTARLAAGKPAHAPPRR